MLTNNFIKVLFILSGNVTATDVNNEQKTMYRMYGTGGTNVTLSYNTDESCGYFTKEIGSNLKQYDSQMYSGNVYNAFYTNSNSSYTSNTLAMLVGTGSTSPTLDDYKLESQIELTSGVDACRMDANSSIITLTREFINNTGAPVTINEVGVYNVSCDRYTSNIFLIGREVLDEPVIIDNGKSYTFSYFIDMSGILPQS